MNQLARVLLISGFISIFITLPSHAEDIYKHVDEKGVPSFSDAKTEGAEVIKVEPVKVQSIATPAPSVAAPTTTQSGFNYSKLDIISPADQTSLRNEQKILVRVAINPSLRQGHQIEFLDNGQALQAASQSLSLELIDFERGTHTLTARIIDKSNKVLKTSNPVTLNVFRTTTN